MAAAERTVELSQIQTTGEPYAPHVRLNTVVLDAERRNSRADDAQRPTLARSRVCA